MSKSEESVLEGKLVDVKPLFPFFKGINRVTVEDDNLEKHHKLYFGNMPIYFVRGMKGDRVILKERKEGGLFKYIEQRIDSSHYGLSTSSFLAYHLLK